MVVRRDPAMLRQFAAPLLPGAVIHCFQPIANKLKFHVLISAKDERSIGFLINTQPSPFIQRRPERMQRHVPLLLQHHPFMDHDSFVACDETVKLPGRAELLDRLCNREIEYSGSTARDLFGPIALAAAGSPLISSRDAALIAAAFTRQLNTF
jgi:hypothetical protein